MHSLTGNMPILQWLQKPQAHCRYSSEDQLLSPSTNLKASRTPSLPTHLSCTLLTRYCSHQHLLHSAVDCLGKCTWSLEANKKKKKLVKQSFGYGQLIFFHHTTSITRPTLGYMTPPEPSEDILHAPPHSPSLWTYLTICLWTWKFLKHYCSEPWTGACSLQPTSASTPEIEDSWTKDKQLLQCIAILY